MSIIRLCAAILVTAAQTATFSKTSVAQPCSTENYGSSTIYSGRGWIVRICPDYPSRFVSDPSGVLAWNVRFGYVDATGYNDANHVHVTAIISGQTRCVCNNELSYDDTWTGSDGWASFHYHGGACQIELYVQFQVDDEELNHTYTITPGPNTTEFFSVGPSSDAVDPDGYTLWQHPLLWDPGMVCNTGLSDAAYHTKNIKDNLEDYCSDLDGVSKTDLNDAVHLTPAIKTSTICGRE